MEIQSLGILAWIPGRLGLIIFTTQTAGILIYPLVNYGKSFFVMGQLTVSMAILNGCAKLPEGRWIDWMQYPDAPCIVTLYLRAGM